MGLILSKPLLLIDFSLNPLPMSLTRFHMGSISSDLCFFLPTVVDYGNCFVFAENELTFSAVLMYSQLLFPSSNII